MDRILDEGRRHQTYRGLPALAGLCSMSDALARPGLAVDEVVSRLKRLHYSLRRLHQIFLEQLPAEPIYELKMAFSLHAYVCAEHVAAIAARVGEMREPPLGLEKVPDAALEEFFEEIRRAPTTAERVAALYTVAVPALLDACVRLQTETHPIADQPTRRVCRFALLELNDLAEYGRQAAPCLVDAAAEAAQRGWREHLQALLAAAGGLDGTRPPGPRPTPPIYAARPYEMEVRVRRDERFADPYNMGVNAEAYLHDPQFDAASKVVMLYYKRLREIDVPEVMATIIAQTPGQPWDYYRDMTRQLWDEARHAMLGEIGFVSIGVHWPDVPINFTWSQSLNTQLTPRERHAVLFFIEQGLMPRTGKRYEWEVALASQQPLAGVIQDFDWADEVLHAQIGRKWFVSTMPDLQAALDYGDACWSRVFMNWDDWKSQGLTAHRNWWPEIYRQACASAGVAPSAAALAFATTYRTTRADLKAVAAE